MQSAAPAGREDLLSAIDAAKILGLSADMVRLLAREARLATAAHTVRGQRLFRRADVEELAAERAGHPPHRHMVQFYEDDASICAVVADFTAAALRSNAPVALITTQAHRLDICERLTRVGVDLGAVSSSGQLQLHDAAQCLNMFLTDGMPDGPRFRVAMSALLAEAARPRARVRLFGEMVDLLCETGNHEGAARLETLWNELADNHSFTLLCGYRIRNFARASSRAPFESICGLHTHVVPAESYSPDARLEDCMRGITSLQQRAASLDSEASHRQELEEQLREALAGRARAEDALREQSVRLAEASRAKDEFLALLGHELRNPLAPIQTALELMRLRGQASREQAMLERQVGYLVRLVDDLLDVSRLTRGTIELRRRRVELTGVVQAAVDAASPLLEQRQHQLVIDVPADLVVDVDPERMAQVVSNLLTNAAKYSAPGSSIEVSALAADGRVRLSVVDQGIGIDPDLAARAFDSFVQHIQAIDRSSGGLGLGLAIVRSLVELHGGAVEVRSDGPGRGSQFTVSLPAPTIGAAPEPDDVGARAAAAASRRVLVVDDNEDLAALVGELLEHHGHQVAIAHDGRSAIEAAERFRPEVALLDIGLPVMDGYQLASHLRSALGGILLVAISGYGQAVDRRRSEEAGFSAHLLKPVDPQLLAHVVAAGPDRP